MLRCHSNVNDSELCSHGNIIDFYSNNKWVLHYTFLQQCAQRWTEKCIQNLAKHLRCSFLGEKAFYFLFSVVKFTWTKLLLRCLTEFWIHIWLKNHQIQQGSLVGYKITQSILDTSQITIKNADYRDAAYSQLYCEKGYWRGNYV